MHEPTRTHWQASASNPPPVEQDYDIRMNGPDGGIVNAWLAGLSMRSRLPKLATAAEAGELPVLPYRGGVERALKTKSRVGSLLYVAMWQGLRGNDLDVDTSVEPVLTCARHGVTVRFTIQTAELLASEDE